MAESHPLTSKEHGDIKVARIFNTYGLRMLKNDGRVISNFIVQALNKEPLTINGNGNESFVYRRLDRWPILLMNSKISGPINLGNPEEISIIELASKMLKSKYNIKY